MPYLMKPFDRFLSWLYIRRIWGPRCPDINAECRVCQRWQEHDDLFGKDA